MQYAQIIEKLPYDKPFLFVDELLDVSEDGVTGTFTYNSDLDFYKGHFRGFAVTPGVILTETMAQIGLVCLGIYLMNDQLNNNTAIALTSTQVEFLKPVFPDEKVTVVSRKIYFRFGKLKCSVKMFNGLNEEVCNGVIAGIIRNNE